MPEFVVMSLRDHSITEVRMLLSGHIDLIKYRISQRAADGVDYTDGDRVTAVLQHAEEILADHEARAYADYVARHGRHVQVALLVVTDTPMRNLRLDDLRSSMLRDLATNPASLVTLVDSDGIQLTDLLADR